MRFATQLGIQHNGAPKPNATNEEGHAAFRENLKQSIARIAFTGVLADSFYGKESQQAGEFIPLCMDAANKEPRYLFNAALVSRKANFKLFPKLAIAALLSSPSWPKIEDEAVGLLSTYSAGQLLELALVLKAKEFGKGLGSRAQRVLGLALAKKTTKQIEDMTLSDRSDFQRLLRLLHPKELTPDQVALLPYVLGDVHRATTPRQGAMDALGGSEAQADLIRAHKLPFNATKGSANKAKETWEAIRDNMSTLQILLNLKALDERGAMTPSDLDRILKAVDLAKTRLVPHDVLRPLGMAPGQYREALTSLLARLVSVPIAGLGGKRVGILLDFSGSMAPGYAQNSLGNWVLAVALASPIMAACPNRHLAFFGGQAYFEGQSFSVNHYGQAHKCTFPYLKGCPPEAAFFNLLGLTPDSSTDIAAGINLFQGIELDVLFLFTDEQQNGHTPGQQAWNQYRRKNPKARLVVVNVSNTKWHITGSDPSVTIIQTITPLIYQQFSRFDQSSVEMIENYGV